MLTPVVGPVWSQCTGPWRQTVGCYLLCLLHSADWESCHLWSLCTGPWRQTVGCYLLCLLHSADWESPHLWSHTHTHTISLSLKLTQANTHHHHHHQQHHHFHYHHHHELHHLQFLINQTETPQTFVDGHQRSKKTKHGRFTLWAVTPWCCPPMYRWREACLSTLTPTLLPWGRSHSFCPTLVFLCNTSMVAHHTHSCGWFTLMCSMISYWLKGWWIR